MKRDVGVWITLEDDHGKPWGSLGHFFTPPEERSVEEWRFATGEYQFELDVPGIGRVPVVIPKYRLAEEKFEVFAPGRYRLDQQPIQRVRAEAGCADAQRR